MADTNEKEVASGMIFSCYEKERAEILRLMTTMRFRTPMDVVRWALRRAPSVKKDDLLEPRVRK